jgi:hypothetical protein
MRQGKNGGRLKTGNLGARAYGTLPARIASRAQNYYEVGLEKVMDLLIRTDQLGPATQALAEIGKRAFGKDRMILVEDQELAERLLAAVAAEVSDPAVIQRVLNRFQDEMLGDYADEEYVPDDPEGKQTEIPVLGP